MGSEQYDSYSSTNENSVVSKQNANQWLFDDLNKYLQYSSILMKFICFRWAASAHAAIDAQYTNATVRSAPRTTSIYS